MLLTVVIALVLSRSSSTSSTASTTRPTRSPRWSRPACCRRSTAVAWAAFFNFISAAPVLWGVELKVAATMGKGIIHFPHLQARGPTMVLVVIFAALVGAIVWNLLTWWWGLPSSSSHALAGGMIGATPAGARRRAASSPPASSRSSLFIVLSPLIGMVLGSTMMVVTAWVVRRNTPARVDTWFRRLQLLSAAIFSYSHGTNDAQKVMGIIAVILYGTVWADRAAMSPGHFPVPFWVVLACHAAIGLGTLFGGWRIVKTMGHNLTKLQPIGGFCAETGGGVTILALAHCGHPGLHHPHHHRRHRRAWAPPGGRGPSAGAWPGASSGPGSSRSRPRRWWRRSSTARPARSWRWPLADELGRSRPRPGPSPRPGWSFPVSIPAPQPREPGCCDTDGPGSRRGADAGVPAGRRGGLPAPLREERPRDDRLLPPLRPGRRPRRGAGPGRLRQALPVGRDRYRPSARFKTFLYRVATNHCLNELRRGEHAARQRRSGGTRRSAPDLDALPSGAAGPEEVVQGNGAGGGGAGAARARCRRSSGRPWCCAGSRGCPTRRSPQVLETSVSGREVAGPPGHRRRRRGAGALRRPEPEEARVVKHTPRRPHRAARRRPLDPPGPPRCGRTWPAAPPAASRKPAPGRGRGAGRGSRRRRALRRSSPPGSRRGSARSGRAAAWPPRPLAGRPRGGGPAPRALVALAGGVAALALVVPASPCTPGSRRGPWRGPGAAAGLRDRRARRTWRRPRTRSIIAQLDQLERGEGRP